jgi:hypothetical protein
MGFSDMGSFGSEMQTPNFDALARDGVRFANFYTHASSPPAQKTIPDALRHIPRFSLDVLASLSVPIGEYDPSKPLNLGRNRWYGYLGLPITRFFGTNDNYVGQSLSTDPKFQLDGHLTRDLGEHLWAAIDGSWFYGGTSSVNGVPGEKLNDVVLGLTLGYTLNDNMALTFGYKSTVNDNAPTALRMNTFMVSLLFGWHPIVEGSRRLQGEK